ncbi:unnamed protein product [Caenorhabditis nigoni]
METLDSKLLKALDQQSQSDSKLLYFHRISINSRQTFHRRNEHLHFHKKPNLHRRRQCSMQNRIIPVTQRCKRVQNITLQLFSLISVLLLQPSSKATLDSQRQHPIRVVCTFPHSLFSAKTPSESSTLVVRLSAFWTNAPPCSTTNRAPTIPILHDRSVTRNDSRHVNRDVSLHKKYQKPNSNVWDCLGSNSRYNHGGPVHTFVEFRIETSLSIRLIITVRDTNVQ